jgi:hypothetical protein
MPRSFFVQRTSKCSVTASEAVFAACNRFGDTTDDGTPQPPIVGDCSTTGKQSIGDA